MEQPVAIQSVLDSLSPSDDPNRLGRLGGYEVSGVIGVGGMGVVLKAVDPSLDRVVAIKVMAPHLAHNVTARKRFSREAKAAAKEAKEMATSAGDKPEVAEQQSAGKSDSVPVAAEALASETETPSG